MDIRDSDRRRDYQLIMRIGSAGAAFLLVFGLNALLRSNFLLAAVLLGTAVVGVACLAMMRLTRNKAYGVNGISAAVVLVYVFLIAHGGFEGTGPLWCYPLALILMLLQGFRRGIFAMAGLLLIAIFLLFYPDLPYAESSYPYSFKVRFIASFAALAVMSSIYEYLRWTSQKNYVAISRDLDMASRTDPLTGARNRRDAHEYLQQLFEAYSRNGAVFSVIMVDLDHFKAINDRYGHPAGDALLVAISAHFTSNLRQIDRVSRWGGEEFLIVLPGTHLQAALLVADKLCRSTAEIDMAQWGIVDPVSASFGVQCVDSASDIDDLITRADRMLYAAKSQGRNRVVSEYLGATT